jgi:putative hemolysin
MPNSAYCECEGKGLHQQKREQSMATELCKLKKSLLKEDIEAFVLLVNQPTHVCKKCGRAANNKKLLCNPVKIQG